MHTFFFCKAVIAPFESIGIPLDTVLWVCAAGPVERRHDRKRIIIKKKRKDDGGGGVQLN